MKQCNWCDEVDRQQQLQSTTTTPATAATTTTATTSELPNGQKAPIESNSAIKGESKTSGISSKCAHHQQHHRHHEHQQPIVVDTTGPLPPRTAAAGADQKTKLGAIPAAATAAAANPAAGSGVESLAAFNLLPAHFRDMFLAAHLLRGKLHKGGSPFYFSTARRAITE